MYVHENDRFRLVYLFVPFRSENTLSKYLEYALAAGSGGSSMRQVPLQHVDGKPAEAAHAGDLQLVHVAGNAVGDQRPGMPLPTSFNG